METNGFINSPSDNFVKCLDNLTTSLLKYKAHAYFGLKPKKIILNNHKQILSMSLSQQPGPTDHIICYTLFSSVAFQLIQPLVFNESAGRRRTKDPLYPHNC